MAQRRMFDKSVVCNDRFIELPAIAQALYLHLSMNADDDGFVDNWKSISRMIGASNDDVNILKENGYIIKFDSDIIVISHWNINNKIRKDRRVDTKYTKEISTVILDDNMVYKTMVDNQQPNDNQTATQYSIGKDSIVENNIGKTSEEKDSKAEKREEVEILSPSDIIRKDVINYLNKKINANYDYDDLKTKSLIQRWIDKGHSKLDFKIVVDKKYDEWNDTKFVVQLNPYTLFGDKFEIYLNQPVEKKTLKDISMNDIDKMIEIERENNINDTIEIY